jgi:apolipoprotein N-acyltransferase
LTASALRAGARSLGRARRLALCAALGAVAALGQVPLSLPLATLAALAAVFWLFRRGGLGFGAGWAFGAGHFALALHWIVEPFLVEPEIHGWMAPFALVLMAGGLALFWGAAFGLARRLALGPGGLVALWAGAEMLRSLAFDGFPWALVGHVWIGTPLEQVAGWWGAHGLTLATLAVGAGLAAPGRWRLTGAAGLAAVAAGWWLLDPGPAPAPDPEAPVLRIVQPNVPQAEKWDPLRQPGHLERLLALSAGGKAALTVWPETALTELLEWAGPVLAAGAEAGRAPLATGIVRREGARYFNSLVVTDGTGAATALYDKAHLTPFGEYIPFGDLLGRWGIHGLAASQGAGFSAGPGPALIDLAGIGPARVLICYEGIFAEEIAVPGPRSGPRPRLMLLVTNDAWFGNWAGPRQHLSLARLRAIEQGLPVARAANTGISAMIDGRGRVLESLPLNEAGAILAPLPPALSAPPYARWGDGPAGAGAVLLLLAALMARGRGPGRGIDRAGRGA